MLEVELPRAAAWAPWADGNRDWLIGRDRLAADWLTTRARTDGSPIIVQAPSHAADYRRGRGAVADLARTGKVAT